MVVMVIDALMSLLSICFLLFFRPISPIPFPALISAFGDFVRKTLLINSLFLSLSLSLSLSLCRRPISKDYFRHYRILGKGGFGEVRILDFFSFIGWGGGVLLNFGWGSPTSIFVKILFSLFLSLSSVSNFDPAFLFIPFPLPACFVWRNFHW